MEKSLSGSINILLCLGILLSFCCSNRLHSQDLPSLSQNTNHFISQSSTGEIYISSLDGLNIYNGLKNKVLQPSNLVNMKGSNIQSSCYEDSEGNIWFSTYVALHKYITSGDSLRYFNLEDNRGNILNEDYRVYGIVKDMVFLKAGKSSYVFDAKNEQLIKEVPINNANNYNEKLYSHKTGFKLVATNSNNVYVSYLDKDLNLTSRQTFNVPGFSHEIESDSSIYVGGIDGKLYSIDLNSKKIIELQNISHSVIMGINRSQNGELILCTSSDGCYLYNKIQNSSAKMKSTIDIDGNPKGYNPPFVDKDNILWLSEDGGTTTRHNLNPKQFTSWPSNSKKRYFATSIIPYKNNFLINCRGPGILYLDEQGQLIDNYKTLPSGRENFFPSSWIHPG